MMTKVLTATSKLFILLAVACGLLGLLSTNMAKADPPPCDCGGEAEWTADWGHFEECYRAYCQRSSQCGDPVPPGQTGHEDWAACYNNYSLSIFSCASQFCFDRCFLVGDGVGGFCEPVNSTTCRNCTCRRFAGNTYCR